MSMDLAVWSAQAFKLPDQLPEPEAWRSYAFEWAYDGGGWQIVVSLAEDEPDGTILGKLPAARHVAYVSLEPIGADEQAYQFLEKVTRHLAQQSNGIRVE